MIRLDYNEKDILSDEDNILEVMSSSGIKENNNNETKKIEELQEIWNTTKKKDYYDKIMHYDWRNKLSKEDLKKELKKEDSLFLNWVLEGQFYYNKILNNLNKLLNNWRIVEKIEEIYKEKADIEEKYYIKNEFIQKLINTKDDEILNSILESIRIDTSLFTMWIFDKNWNVVLDWENIVKNFNNYKTIYELELECTQNEFYVPSVRKNISYELEDEKQKKYINIKKEYMEAIIKDILEDSTNEKLNKLIDLKTEIEKFVSQSKKILNKIEQYIYRDFLEEYKKNETIKNILLWEGKNDNDNDIYLKRLEKKANNKEENVFWNIQNKITIKINEDNNKFITYTYSLINLNSISYIFKPLKRKNTYTIKKEKWQKLKWDFDLYNINEKNINVKRWFLKDLYQFKNWIKDKNIDIDIEEFKKITFLSPFTIPKLPKESAKNYKEKEEKNKQIVNLKNEISEKKWLFTKKIFKKINLQF